MNGAAEKKIILDGENSVQDSVAAAQKFFLDRFAIRINDDGSLMEELAEEQLLSLAEWRMEEFEQGGEMPTIEKFFQKTLLAVALWPQKTGQKINYLFGKGHGVEIALQGEVFGRRKLLGAPTMRSHSDFDFYCVTMATPTTYKRVLGSVEIFPPEKTKGLTQLPPTLLSETAEAVLLGKLSVLIPQLELLFIDKVLKNEATPRPDGSDAFLLAKHYDLDPEKIHGYLERHVIIPQKQVLQDGKNQHLTTQIVSIQSFYGMAKDALDADLQLNEKTAHHDVMTKLRVMMSKTFAGTIQTKYWVDAADDEINETGEVISEALKKRIQIKVDQSIEQEFAKLDQLHIKFDELLALARQARES